MNSNQVNTSPIENCENFVLKNEQHSQGTTMEKLDAVFAPSSPSLPKQNGSKDKEINKIASKAFGYIQRSIELLGKESARLSGARDFSNTLHWTQAMKFLKERGYIYTKTGHGTSVAEQYVNLGGLEKSFQDQFSLENIPLPRLSKTQLEKLDSKNFEESATKLYDFAPFPQYRTFQDYSVQKGLSVFQQQSFSVSKPPKVENSILIQPTSQYGISIPQAIIPNESRKFSSELSARSLPPNELSKAIPQNPLSRLSSVPEVPLPSCPAYQNKPQMTKQYPQAMSNSGRVDTLPPLTMLTDSLPEGREPPKTNNVHSLLQIPIQLPPASANPELVAQESLNKLRQIAVDALLLQSFSEVAQGEEFSRKRLPPPSSTFSPNKEKKAKLDYNSLVSEFHWRYNIATPVSNYER